MKENDSAFNIYNPYDESPQLPQEIGERLVAAAPAGYVKVSVEGDRILEPVTADKNRLDVLIDQYHSSIVLVRTSGGFDVYAPEIFAKGRHGENN